MKHNVFFGDKITELVDYKIMKANATQARVKKSKDVSI